MGETTVIVREVDATGKDIAMWKSAADETYIQQTAFTDDDGTLLAKAQANYLFILYRPHLKAHGAVGTSI